MRAFLFFVILFGPDLWAQEAGSNLDGLKIEGAKRRGPQIQIDIANPLEPSPEDSPNYPFDQKAHWSRFTGGIWGAYANAAVFGSMFRFSKDQAFLGGDSESVWGLGVFADLGVRHSYRQAIRAKLGVLRSKITAGAFSLEESSATQLETETTLLLSSLSYRWKFADFLRSGVLWFGVGARFLFVIGSDSSSSSVETVSELRNTMGLGLMGSFGWDFPIGSESDLSVEFNWLPWSSFQGMIGLRTSL